MIANYISSNPNIVYVDGSGMITGVSVGSAKITAVTADGKNTANCTVTIKPQSTLFTEPVISFGSTIELIKSKETRTLFGTESDTIQHEVLLDYQDTNPAVKDILYLFESGKLTSIWVFFTQTSTLSAELKTFLQERYKYMGVSAPFTLYIDRAKGYWVGSYIEPQLNLGLSVEYVPPLTNSTKIQPQKTPSQLISDIKMIRNFYKTKGIVGN